jgi:hypothetical protein
MPNPISTSGQTGKKLTKGLIFSTKVLEIIDPSYRQ